MSCVIGFTPITLTSAMPHLSTFPVVLSGLKNSAVYVFIEPGVVPSVVTVTTNTAPPPRVMDVSELYFVKKNEGSLL